MVTYNFKKRFVAAIVAGHKRHTIRGQRKRHARPGEQLQLQHGPRMKPVRLGTATCTHALAISINLGLGQIKAEGTMMIETPEDLDSFARRDGFADWADMRAFWRAEHKTVEVFDGVLIAWDYATFKPADPVAQPTSAKAKGKTA